MKFIRSIKQFSTIILALLLFTGCSKNNKDQYYGIDTIDNKLYGTQTYYALGFSFELGSTTSTLESPQPDITIHVNTDVAGNITGKYINTPNLVESFALAGSYDTAVDAEDHFNSLLEVGTRTWTLNAPDVKENQIWIFKTVKGNYVKFRILDLTTDNSINPPFISMRFEWRLQPDGSATFGS